MHPRKENAMTADHSRFDPQANRHIPSRPPRQQARAGHRNPHGRNTCSTHYRERSTMLQKHLRTSATRALIAVATIAATGLAHANATHSAFSDPADSVATDGFNNLTSARLTAADLVAGVASNTETDGNAVLTRTSGGAYPASSGLYQWSGSGSTFAMSVSNAVDGLTGIVFQSYINVSTGANGIFGLLSADNLPRLNFNGGEQFLLASTQTSENLGYTDFFTGQFVASDPNNPNHVTFTWDFASLGVTVPVDSFTITFATDNHAQTTAFQLDQLSVAAPVPEPQTAAMLLGGMAVISLIARRRKNLN
jgi:hypothetical protein